MQYKIEKGIPLPTERRTRKYPLNQMVVGDSFFVPAKEVSSRNALSGIVSMQGTLLGRKFTTHKEHNGYRVWRTK